MSKSLINKNLLFWIVIVILIGCTHDLDNIKYVGSQTHISLVATPNGFQVTPAQAIQKSEEYFISNPFALLVFADNNCYYINIASFNMSPEKAKKEGITIDGRTGNVLRGEKRIIGK